MQTFLPVPDIYKSAQLLDYRRLGKQRVEAMQLINTIQHGGGWENHPACRMWRFHVTGLMAYHDACVTEWVRRGYQNNMTLYGRRTYSLPPWFGDPVFHASHRAALLAKAPSWYGQFGWPENPDINYVWPDFVH